MAARTTITAADVINQANNGPPFSDADIVAECPSCGDVQLSKCTVTQGEETTYMHRCGNTMLIIGAPNPDGKPWPGRGYRLNDFVLRNAVVLRIGRVRVDASPAALASARGD